MENTDSNLWICASCREVIETGESTAHADAAKPLSLVEGAVLAFAGANQGDDGINFMGTDPCPGCGSRLVGVRFMYAKI